MSSAALATPARRPGFACRRPSFEPFPRAPTRRGPFRYALPPLAEPRSRRRRRSGPSSTTLQLPPLLRRGAARKNIREGAFAGLTGDAPSWPPWPELRLCREERRRVTEGAARGTRPRPDAGSRPSKGQIQGPGPAAPWLRHYSVGCTFLKFRFKSPVEGPEFPEDGGSPVISGRAPEGDFGERHAGVAPGSSADGFSTAHDVKLCRSSL